MKCDIPIDIGVGKGPRTNNFNEKYHINGQLVTPRRLYETAIEHGYKRKDNIYTTADCADFLRFINMIVGYRDDLET